MFVYCIFGSHELWINLRRESHSKETWPHVGYKCKHSPLLTVYKQDEEIVIFLAARWEQSLVQNQAEDEWDANICFSSMLRLHSSPAFSSCQSSGVTCQLLLPHLSELAGSAASIYPVIWLCRGLVLIALLLIMELGERATPTHWLIGGSRAGCWDIISRNAESQCSLAGFSSTDSLPHCAYL